MGVCCLDINYIGIVYEMKICFYLQFFLAYFFNVLENNDNCRNFFCCLFVNGVARNYVKNPIRFNMTINKEIQHNLQCQQDRVLQFKCSAIRNPIVKICVDQHSKS